MSVRLRSFALVLVVPLLLGTCLAGIVGHAAVPGDGASRSDAAASNIFNPSNARTEDGKPISAADFFPAERCASCHKDTHAAWSESLHRNAARDPFYKESVDILERARGSRLTQHCESCHSPVAVLSGSLLQTKAATKARPMEDEGVSCSVCHSITEARLDGTGSYTIHRPALLVRKDGTPVFGEVSDEDIIDDIEGHKRAMMRPLLKQPEFCAACHKSSAPPQLNNYKFIRGFSAYDEWQQSGASGNTVAPYYRREQRMDCRACHMPKVESKTDLAARDGVISSHRWIGANTTTPLFYRQKEQVELTAAFLKNKVLSVDIFALKNVATGQLYAQLDNSTENRLALRPGEEVTAEVVVFNRKAAHSFPPELRDMYEPWVEFEVLDQTGKSIFHSGFLKPDGTLDESAHVYKSVLLDESARVITRHQMWAMKVKAYDNMIPAGRGDIARYRFRIPQELASKAAASQSLTLRARVNYRRFIQEYTDYVLRRQRVRLEIPVVRMAEAQAKIVLSGTEAAAGTGKATARPASGSELERQALRWNDYAIGLFEQAQYGAAAEAFRHAAELNPRDPNPLVSAAVAELKTEQYGLARDQIGKAAVLLEKALRLNSQLGRTRFYYALLLRSQGKSGEAAEALAKLAAEYPNDREVARQWGQTLYSLGHLAQARVAFETVLRIDPTDTGAYQFLAPIYASEGRPAEADAARSRYLLWRDDPLADSIAATFFAANPQWADERVLAHAHGNDSPLRPVLSGALASPE